jgi:hypothetical protein
MSRRTLVTAALLLAVGLLLASTPAVRTAPQELADVFVTNFPKIQEVEGTVAVKGPIKSASLVRIENIIVSPVKRADTTRLIEAGTLVTDGYPYLVLSLTGQVKGEVGRPGNVGAVFLPDEETVVSAFHEKGLIMFPLEVESGEITPSSSYFDSRQPRFVVGFPRYRVLLYNTSDKSAEVDLFAYLTN